MGLQMYSSSSQHTRVAASVLLLFFFCTLLSRAHGGGSRKLYIAYLGDVKHGHPDDVIASHHDMLATLLQSKEKSLASMVYHYKHGFSGFAAMLTADQAKRLAELPGVISVEPSRTIRTTTTRTWDFLGLNYQSSHTPANELLHMSNYGGDVIIGVVDGGQDLAGVEKLQRRGYGPVPSRWKGECQTGPDWGINNCSRKIIGARFYSAGIPDALLKKDSLSPRDYYGHGTHTASTAAGSAVGVEEEAASFHGLAAGVARGGAPRARIAVYKSLWADGFGSSATVLAAMDDAIHDGVDVLSLSLTASGENSFGALHAVQKGITVVYSAGNDGPRPQTVEDTSPWVLTVAASKIDRSFPTVITLGNKQQMVGQSLYYQVKNNNSSSPRTSSFTELKCARSCVAGDTDLDGMDVKGAIVVCLNDEQAINPSADFAHAAQYVVEGGGSGLIFAQYTTDNIIVTADGCPGIACVIVDVYISRRICQYADSSSPMAKIEPTRTATGKEVLAPKVASFSSRGPSADYPGFIKPDVAAPGANILAAVRDSYEIMSGTSMAAPHVAGIAALLKALHPDWSPAAIKSAMVTTAHVTDVRGMPILAEGLPRKAADPFDYGGGNINPCGAAHPGLIYDIDPQDYNKFFRCAIVEEGTSAYASCNATATLPAYNLNLPSISVPDLRSPIIVSRTVTNVGEVHSVYHVTVQSPTGVKMEVFPPVLVFDAANKVRKFDVKLSPMWNLQGDYMFGSVTWQNDRQAVRIPVAARITIQDFYADVA